MRKYLSRILSFYKIRLFGNLLLIPPDVPQNGDCFYLAIQLFIGQHHNPPFLTSVHFLRNEISNFLTNTPAGSSILRTYNHTQDIIVNTLPSLKPASFPNRDTFAQDYAVAAMATLLGIIIKIFTTHDTTPILHIFTPCPKHTPLLLLPSTPPPISLWADRNHFQLLLNSNLSLPSLTDNLLPMPPIPSQNTDLQGKRIIIKPPQSHNFKSPCPFSDHTTHHLPKGFCNTNCHQHCPNHCSAFLPIPHQRFPAGLASSSLIATAGATKNTPILEISSTILSKPSQRSFPITPHHHTEALHTHPLIQLMYSKYEPNCHLEPILILEPTPHIKLFIVTTEHVLPYSPLRIRPPPEPPPIHILPPSSSTMTDPTKRTRSLITPYFKRHTSNP